MKQFAHEKQKKKGWLGVVTMNFYAAERAERAERGERWTAMWFTVYSTNCLIVIRILIQNFGNYIYMK